MHKQYLLRGKKERFHPVRMLSSLFEVLILGGSARAFCPLIFVKTHQGAFSWKGPLPPPPLGSVGEGGFICGTHLSWTLSSLKWVSEWVKVAQSCPTLCHPMQSPWPAYSPGQNTGVGSLSFVQGIFRAQGSNPGLTHHRQILYQLSYQEAQEDWSG